MLKRILIERYKSIKSADITFGKINVLIGENGAGKSNLISFIELCQSTDLDLYVRTHLGMGRLLHGGAKKSKEFSGTLVFESLPDETDLQDGKASDCAVALTVATAIDGITPVVVEKAQYLNIPSDKDYELGDKHLIGGLEELRRIDRLNLSMNHQRSSEALATTVFQTYYLKVPIDSVKIYHFCDTGDHAGIRGMSNLNDNVCLKKDGSNLASVLYLISQNSPHTFKMIEAMMRRVAPYFQCFELKPDRLNPNLITIEWKEKDSDIYCDSTSFSDGTIRFLALCVLLMQPNPPATIIIDEPELGLHPSAISIIGALVRRAAHKTQVIVATQSADLISEFSIDEIIVVDRIKGESVFHKLEERDFEQWLDDYTLGDIWKKNLIGGRP